MFHSKFADVKNPILLHVIFNINATSEITVSIDTEFKYLSHYWLWKSNKSIIKNILDIERYAGVILMDLKAFDTINYELLLAKLHACGFSVHLFLVLSSYLSNKKQRVKTNNSFSF